MYSHIFKRILDLVGSIIALIIFAIPMAIIAIVIKREDPGPAFFRQKRVARCKNHFFLYKFRSMKMSTPHDIPTHLLDNPEQYLLKCGKTLRKYSLDELPQLINILKGEMSIIGPRPALWNQDDLIEERDIHKANSCKPGLTGWAQINGRDEIEISEKARLDGVYAQKLLEGGFTAFFFDCKCFFATILKVFKGEGVVEGGTGKMKKEKGKDQ